MATTTGFVQQLSLFAGPAACFWVGETPSTAELLTVVVTSSDTAADITAKRSRIAALVEAAGGGQRVDVAHPDGSAAASDVTYPLDNAATRPLQLDGLEVTQAVQDISQSVPLLAGKKAVVRAYLSHHSAPGITVTGEVSLRKAPTDPPVVVASTAAVVLDPAAAGDLAITRNNITRSLNFVVPDSMASEGPLHITLSRVTNTVTGADLTIGRERRPTVWFHRAAPLRVRVYGVRYTQGSPAVTYLPSDRDFASLLSWLARAYPAGQVHSTTALVTATASPPFTCGDVNAQVAALRALDMDAGEDQRTHYYALVSDGGFFMRGCAGVPVNTPNPGAVGSGPTGPGTWGWDFDGSYGDWYGGHELGHTFGRKHPGFCGETNDDNDYPYPSGQLGGDDISFMGFDVGDAALGIPMAALPGTTWKDVMTYCNFQWLSAYTYLGIRKRLVDEDNLGSTPAALGRPVLAAAGAAGSSGGRPDERFPRSSSTARDASPGETGTGAEGGLVSVVATVNLTRSRGLIRYVTPVPNAQPSPTEAESDVRVRVLGSDGEVQADYGVPVRVNSDQNPDDDVRGLVDVVVPAGPAAAMVQLVLSGDVADTFRGAGSPPQARSLQAETAPEGDLAFRVEGLEPATGQSYYVQVSQNDGRSWTTLAVGLTDPDFTLDRGQFPHGQQLLVRVVGTNGFTRSVISTQNVRT